MNATVLQHPENPADGTTYVFSKADGRLLWSYTAKDEQEIAKYDAACRYAKAEHEKFDRAALESLNAACRSLACIASHEVIPDHVASAAAYFGNDAGLPILRTYVEKTCPPALDVDFIIGDLWTEACEQRGDTFEDWEKASHEAGGWRWLVKRVRELNGEPPKPGSSAPFPVESALQQSGRGQPLSNVNNAIIMLAANTGARTGLLISYDEFSGKVFVKWPTESAPDVLTDEDFTHVQLLLQRGGLVATTDTTARSAVRYVARNNTFDAVRDWLNSLTWDGTRRLSLMMVQGFGTPAERYYIRAGRNMLLSMVARAMDPGCQVDEALVLEGPQGSLKSSALRIIGGEFFKELTASPNSKDFEQQLQGVWLGEFAELNALRRTEDIARVKQFITCREDHLRLPYDRVVSDLPRRTVLCGSTNEDCWLHDPTGGRRFIPVTVGAINLEWLRSNRDQLFAEAVTLYKAGRQWWRYPRAATLAEQGARAADDPWSESIRKYLCGRSDVNASDILNHVLQIPTERQTKAHSTRVGVALKRLGCKAQAMRRLAGGRRIRPWIVPAEFAEQPVCVAGPVQPAPIESHFDLVRDDAA